jgi:hypothetical protein
MDPRDGAYNAAVYLGSRRIVPRKRARNVEAVCRSSEIGSALARSLLSLVAAARSC